MKIVKCNGCGSEVQVHDGSLLESCPYCGTKYVQNQAQNTNLLIPYDYSFPYNNVKNSSNDTNRTNDYQSSSYDYQSFNPDNTNDFYNQSNLGANNSNSGKKDKYISLLLCAFLGIFGAHKFYEEKYVMGILYLLTYGFLFMGVIADFIVLLNKPRYYYK